MESLEKMFAKYTKISHSDPKKKNQPAEVAKVNAFKELFPKLFDIAQKDVSNILCPEDKEF
jgi:hypothetical protein